MERFLYIVAAIFVIIWALGFFLYSLGAIIHLFLILAVIALLIKLVRSIKYKQTKNT